MGRQTWRSDEMNEIMEKVYGPIDVEGELHKLTYAQKWLVLHVCIVGIIS